MTIRWNARTGHGREGSLFAAFAALARGEAESFPALRPHQREPWHAFCVQVAALALLHAGRRDLPESEQEWRALLLGLTPAWPEGETWELVVDDWSKPALLQPPVVSESNRADYKHVIATPDALDLLVTAKNHDLKAERMLAASAEHWLFALVTLQTYEGYLGAGNFGISRMNGGLGSRMSLGIRPPGGAATAFRRDVLRLVASRDSGLTGKALLWLEPWDGTLQLAFERLDPLYVDICRRIRLGRSREGLVARAAGSKVSRVASADLKGITHDPWAPVFADGSKSVTPTAAGFGYRQMTRYLDPREIARPVLAHLADDDVATGLALEATAVVRGQGKTEGFHYRRIPISRRVTRSIFGPDEILDRAGQIGRERAEAAGLAGRILRRALIALCQGGPEQARLDDDSAGRKVERWLSAYDRDVDREFFDDAFWSEIAGEEAPHRKAWHERLARFARAQFQAAVPAAPRTEMRRYRAVVRAEAMLESGLRKFVREAADG